MAERLTNTLEETPKKGFGLKFCSDRNCNSDEDCCNCYAFNQTINKLRQLEDIMEKYGIESVEELDYLLEVFKEMRKQYGKLNQENCKSKKELDTWKRAFEMACAFLSKITQDNVCDYEDYFYQQAKKEGEQEEVQNC